MEVKIKSNNELVDATIEMIDGVMIVAPKKVKFEPKEGDVITCKNSVSTYTLILKEVKDDIVYSYAVLPSKRRLIMDDWFDYKNPRPATEEEKQKLFKALADEGWEWDVKERKLVKVKWKPKIGERVYILDGDIGLTDIFFSTVGNYKEKYDCQYNLGRVFKTMEECQEYCDKLNEAIGGIKP